MKYCRFLPLDTSVARNATPLYGLLKKGQIRELSGAPWGKWSRTTRTWPLADVRLAAPVEPSKLVCVGRNFAAHAAELGHEVPKEPLMFLSLRRRSLVPANLSSSRPIPNASIMRASSPWLWAGAARISRFR